MSEHLTCLVSESHLVKIAKNNDVFEKKCQIFEQQRQVLERNMELSEVCCEQVKRMAHLVDDKRKVLKEDVEKQQQETRKFVKESEELVDATFEKINSIRTQSAPKLDADSIAFLISLAYDEYIQNGQNSIAELSQEVEETSRKHELLTQEREEISRQRELVDKAIAKAEKENSALKASLARKKEEAAKLDGVRNQKLLEAKKENEAAVKSRVEVEKEVEVARKSAEENRKTIVAIESERDEWRMKIEKIDTMILVGLG
uniref:Uncharacterized protein n=1 Tax=Caenorhabditis japonica TaxID=281687 RepID=A0A8R1I3U6_CAEJA